jgi:hypothetical protein
LFQLAVLFYPARTNFRRYSLATPEPFSGVPSVRAGVLAALFVAGSALIIALTRRLPELAVRPRRTAIVIWLSGVVLHLALIGSLQEGFQAFHRRALTSGHAVFLVEAVAIRDLRTAMAGYEDLAGQSVFFAVKGPGVLALFHAMNAIANADPVRPLTALAAPTPGSISAWLPANRLDIGELDQLRHLLGFMFLTYPWLACAPVLLIVGLGVSQGRPAAGIIGAAAYVMVPGLALSVAHLDFTLFPLLAFAIVATFVAAMTTRRPAWAVASALLFVLYLSVTLAAAALVSFFSGYIASVLVHQRLRRERVWPAVLDTARAAIVFTVVSAAAIAALQAALDVDLLARYQNAREVQRIWVTEEYDAHWMTGNLLGYFLSFGLTQAVLLWAQQWRTTWRVGRGVADRIDHLTIGWTCLLLGLVLLARQHGETNRLWAFLSPMACLIVGRWIVDLVPQKRWPVMLIVFLAGLLLARVRLSYF